MQVDGHDACALTGFVLGVKSDRWNLTLRRVSKQAREQPGETRVLHAKMGMVNGDDNHQQ